MNSAGGKEEFIDLTSSPGTSPQLDPESQLPVPPDVQTDDSRTSDQDLDPDISGEPNRPPFFRLLESRIFTREVRDWLTYFGWIIISLLVSIFVAFSLAYSVEDNIAVVVFASLFIAVGLLRIVKLTCGSEIVQGLTNCCENRARLWKIVGWCVWGALILLLLTVIIRDAIDSPENLIALAGIALLVIVSFFISISPAQVSWRIVLSGIVVQSLIGLAVMRSTAVYNAIAWVANIISGYLNFATYGAVFVFGESYTDHGFAMGVAPILCFFTATTCVLNHLGVLQVVIRAVGSAFSMIIPTSKVESFVVVASIFLGPDSAVIMIKSMMPMLSNSQLHTLFSSGMATIDAGMIPIYESIGIPASHMISASLMSAPAAIVFSKLLFPEMNASESIRDLVFDKSRYRGVVDAFRRGALDAIPIICGMLAVLLAFISLLEFVNATLTWFGDRVGIVDLTLQLILSYAFLPLTFLMGVEWADCQEVARLIGVKTIVNEFVAYVELGELIDNRLAGRSPSISIRSETIAAYALCGYSNIGTVGFMVGFFTSLAPTRKSDITSMAFRALIASSFACFSTACTAGLFYQNV